MCVAVIVPVVVEDGVGAVVGRGEVCVAVTVPVVVDVGVGAVVGSGDVCVAVIVPVVVDVGVGAVVGKGEVCVADTVIVVVEIVTDGVLTKVKGNGQATDWQTTRRDSIANPFPYTKLSPGFQTSVESSVNTTDSFSGSEMLILLVGYGGEKLTGNPSGCSQRSSETSY